MKVTFRTNLGSIDAKPLELDHTKCTVGKSLDVKTEVGERLVDMGIATRDAEDDELVKSKQEEEARVAALKAQQGVAPAPAITAPATPANFADNPHDVTKGKVK